MLAGLLNSTGGDASNRRASRDSGRRDPVGIDNDNNRGCTNNLEQSKCQLESSRTHTNKDSYYDSKRETAGFEAGNKKNIEIEIENKRIEDSAAQKRRLNLEAHHKKIADMGSAEELFIDVKKSDLKLDETSDSKSEFSHSRPYECKSTMDSDNCIPSNKFDVGKEVEANFKGRGVWKRGKITTYNRNQTYGIVYDDGDFELKAKESLIRQICLISAGDPTSLLQPLESPPSTFISSPISSSKDTAESQYSNSHSLRLARLHAIKRSAYALAIQSRWRGFMVRKKRAKQMPSSRLVLKNPYFRPLISNVLEINIVVDFAIALPVNISSVRLSVKLLDSKRQVVGHVPPPCFAHLTSDLCNPVFSMACSWATKNKNFALTPDITLVCRIDTLERPTLQYKTLGYATLKVFASQSGSQPDASVISPSLQQNIYLNSGNFLIPLVQGFVPVSVPFSEALMQEQLRLVSGAYLGIRLFEGADKNSSSSRTEITPISHMKTLTTTGYSNYVISYHRRDEKPDELILNSPPKGCSSFEGSIASILLMSIPFATGLVKDLKFSEAASAFAQGRISLQTDGALIQTVFDELIAWQDESMPPPSMARELVSSTYMYRYLHGATESGSTLEKRLFSRVKVGIDQLYNMPRLFVDIPTINRKVINKAKIFKTFVRFLGNAGKSNSKNGIDFSKSFNMNTPCQFQSYTNDSYQDIDPNCLTPESCLLVEVFAVDVAIFMSRHASDEFDINNDVHVSKVPSVKYWGIIPIFINSPFNKPGSAKVQHLAFEGLNPNQKSSKYNDSFAFLNTGTHLVPLFEGAVPVNLLNAVRPFKVLTDLLGSTSEPAINFTAGAAVMVRISDMLLASFAGKHVDESPGLSPQTALLERLASAASKGSSELTKRLADDFQYNSLLAEAYPAAKDVLSALYPSVAKKSGGENSKFENSEFYRKSVNDNLNAFFDKISNEFVYE